MAVKLLRSGIFFITLSLAFLLFNKIIYAQNYGAVTGKVTDATTGEQLPGANILLEGTNLGAASNLHGDYRINGIIAGDYILKAEYIGYKTYTKSITVVANRTLNLNVKLTLSAVKIKDVVVNGIRKGQTKALNQQKTSNTIESVLSKEEMEKFPDLNTADVLQRMPGVNVQKSLGTGRFVFIRGTEPRLTTVTVNGQKIASPEDQERYVGLDAINSSQLAEIQVIKAITPDMDADAIGGSVNLITRSAFDNTNNVLKLNAGSGDAFLGSNPLYKFSGNYSMLFGKDKRWGLTLGGSYNGNRIVAHSDEFDWQDNNDINGNLIKNSLDDFRLFFYNTKRNTYGGNASLEYKINSENHFFARVMLNRINDIQTRNMIRYRVGKGDYLSPTLVSKARMAYELQDRTESRTINAYSIGGANSIGNLAIDYTASYSYGSEDRTDPAAFKSEWQLNQKVNLSLNLSDENFPGIKITNTDFDKNYVQNPANWEIDNQDWRSVLATNKNFTGSLNFKLPFNIANSSSMLKFGGKYTTNKKDRNGDRIKYKWKGNNDVFMSQIASSDKINDFLLDHYSFAPIPDRDKFISFFNANKDKDNALRPSINRDDNDGSGGDFSATEDVTAGYAMATMNFGDFKLLFGARDEHTTTTYDGKQLNYSPSGDYISTSNVAVTNSYNKVVPAVHIRYAISNLANIRFAYTGGISRPDYWSLAPYKWIYAEDREIVEGNSKLNPTTSQNLDLMFGYYFSGIGVLNVGGFYKRLDDIIFNSTRQITGGEFDGFDLTQAINGGTANLYGFELSWMQQFTFLPGFFNGFGIYANYTFTNSDADLVNRDRNVLPGQAGNTGNAGINYEKDKLSARLSLNFQDKVLNQVGKTADFDRWTDSRLELDFSSAYTLLKGFELYFDLLNITNEPQREYYGTNKPRVNEYYGLSMRAGLKLTM